MSRDRGSRRLYPVAVESSASALLAAASLAGNSKSTGNSDLNVNSRLSQAPLPGYVALNFNFKPDSTHDCKRGALFQPGPSRNVNADWQLELESTETEKDAGPSSVADGSNASKRNPAHVFSGPQSAVKAYDLVLVWDEEAKVYRLDRIASAFSLKYERSKTVLSAQSQDVWKRDAAKAKKRSIADDHPIPRSAAAGPRDGVRRLDNTAERDLDSRSTESSASLSSSKSSGSELKLRSKASTVMAPVRRSSRRSLAVEMEEFEDRSQPPAEPSGATSASRSKRSSVSKESDLHSKEDSKRVKLPDPVKEHGYGDELAGGLRRSRRRSSQTQAEEASQPSAPEPDPAPRADALESVEVDYDDLALELERELERELEVDMQDASEPEEQTPFSAVPPLATAKSTWNRSLSPVSRLKRGERQMKISTPKAHTPELDEASAYQPSALSKAFLRPNSPLTDRSNADEAVPTSTAASIGLGLHQTGVGITPTASPRLDIASPDEISKSPLAIEQAAAESLAHDSDSDADEEGEEDDDLQDFAAELDMSLAEVVPDPAPALAPAVVEKRRSSRAHAASQSVSEARPRQVRKAYGLGGPRQEEEELEDSE